MIVYRKLQKQLSRDAFSKRCSQNMQTIYGRTPLTKCDFKFAAYFQISFLKNTSRWLLLKLIIWYPLLILHTIYGSNFNVLAKFLFTKSKSELDYYTAWKVCIRNFSGPYFHIFVQNTEIYSVNLCIHSEFRKIRNRNNSEFGHFSHSVSIRECISKY